MDWTIGRRAGHVALVTMPTNKVNAQNPTIFDDLHRAFDQLEAEFNDCGVVLTGTGRVFSTVAAINGHAYAGGLITAFDCNMRIAAEGDLQFSLNEVPIGIPMPAVYCEIIKYAIGPTSANEMTLFGRVYGLADAQRMGVVNHVVSPDRLLDEAVKWAAAVELGCHPAYTFSERALQAATLRAMESARRLDLDLLAAGMTDMGSLRAHARRYRELKSRDPSWRVLE
jgi:enoyl-CoA hydratase